MAAKKMKIEDKKVVTPKFRASHVQVFEAKAYKDQPAKYGIVMLFPKATTDLKAMKLAARNAAIERWGADESDWPKADEDGVGGLKWPFRDGDKYKKDPSYKGHWFVRASSKKKPGVIDQAKNPIESEDEFYSGCYARAVLIAFAYENSGNNGVSFTLQNLQKWGDGEKLSGRRDASADFEVIEIEEGAEATGGEVDMMSDDGDDISSLF